MSIPNLNPFGKKSGLVNIHRRWKTALALQSASKVQIDRLEHRIHWSVSQDANGWTVVTPSPGERIIYVSSSTGNDSNTGLSISAPVKSFAKAESLIVNGQPNEVLLKSGDTFNDSFINWTYSGLDAQDPLLVSYYGTGALPVIDSGTNADGFATPLNQPQRNAAVDYLDVIGLQFDASDKDPYSSTFNASAGGGVTGFYFKNPGNDVLIEDCSFQYYELNFDIEDPEGPVTDFTIRRTVDAYAYNTNSTDSARSQGLYALGVDGLTITQCVFDHDGWSEVVPNAADIGYNHDIYIDPTSSNVVITDNIIAEASFAGVMARAGGQIDNNIFIDNPIAVSFGSADSSLSKAGGVSGSLIGNTIVGDRALGVMTSDPTIYGQGFTIANTAPGADVIVADNIFTQNTQNGKPAIQLEVPVGTTNPSVNVGINDLTIENNIANGFRIGIMTDGRFVPGGTGLYALNDLKVLDNDFINSLAEEVRHDGSFSSAQESWSGDRYYDTVLAQSSWVTLQSNPLSFSTWQSSYDLGSTVLSAIPYTNINVSVSSYDALLGGPGTWQDFLAQARQLSIYNYRPQYMAQDAVTYIQQGFDVASTFTNGTPNVPPTAIATTTALNTSTTGTTYSFTVIYTDGALLNDASLGNGNLLVDGPNGYSQYATYMSTASPTVDTSGYQHTVVTYQITSPLLVAWNATDNGNYTIDLLPNQVTDTLGNVAQSAVIGSFSVDFTLPTAIVTAPNLTSAAAGTSTYAFTITYSDSAGIDTTTLSSYQVLVTGPSSYSKYATYSGESTSSNGSIIATYTVPAPGGSWTAAANGTYTISLAANSVYDLAGNAAAGGVLATFNANLSSSTNPLTGSASIAGIVFNDANGDGVYDNRENTLNGVTLFIDLAGTGVLASGDPTAVTNSSGAYSFTSLPAGTYTILEVAPAGFEVTTPTSGSNVVTLAATTQATGVNFANQVGTGTTSTGGNTGGTNTNGSTGTTTTGNIGTGVLHKVASGKTTTTLASA